MQDNQANQLIREHLAKHFPQDQLDQASEKLIDLVMQETLTSLPEAQANQLRSQIENGATPEEMEATIKSANLDLEQIVQKAISKLTENK